MDEQEVRALLYIHPRHSVEKIIKLETVESITKFIFESSDDNRINIKNKLIAKGDLQIIISFGNTLFQKLSCIGIDFFNNSNETIAEIYDCISNNFKVPLSFNDFDTHYSDLENCIPNQKTYSNAFGLLFISDTDEKQSAIISYTDETEFFAVYLK